MEKKRKASISKIVHASKLTSQRTLQINNTPWLWVLLTAFARSNTKATFLLRRNSDLNFWRFLLNHFRSVFPLLLLFSWLSTILFIGREIHETVPISKMFFTFLQIKNFFVECLQSTALQTANGYKRQEFWCETRTPLWLLIGCIIFFSHLKKHFLQFWLEVSCIHT